MTSSKHIHTPWGEALTVALATAGGKNRKPSFHTQEALLSAVELIRFEVLTDKPYTKTYSRIAGNGINFVFVSLHYLDWMIYKQYSSL